MCHEQSCPTLLSGLLVLLSVLTEVSITYNRHSQPLARAGWSSLPPRAPELTSALSHWAVTISLFNAPIPNYGLRQNKSSSSLLACAQPRACRKAKREQAMYLQGTEASVKAGDRDRWRCMWHNHYYNNYSLWASVSSLYKIVGCPKDQLLSWDSQKDKCP